MLLTINVVTPAGFKQSLNLSSNKSKLYLRKRREIFCSSSLQHYIFRLLCAGNWLRKLEYLLNSCSFEDILLSNSVTERYLRYEMVSACLAKNNITDFIRLFNKNNKSKIVT